MRQIYFSKYDIALSITTEHGKTRWTNLLRRFVDNRSEKHISRQKLSNYLKELIKDGLVKKLLMFRNDA